MALHPVALITGGSSGIGEALAHVFAARGHHVVLVARNEAALKAVADSVAGGGRARPVVVAADLGRMDAGARLSHELGARGLEPAFVVNNAGFGLAGRAETLDRAEQLAMIDLNVRTVTDFSLRWIDSARRHNGGILNVASIAGFFPGPGMAVYYATKAYLVSFTEALHKELMDTGVRVTALCPPSVPTNFQARAGISKSAAPKAFTVDAETVALQGYEGLMAGKRLVMPGLPTKLAIWASGMAPRGLVLGAINRHNRQRKPPENPSWPRPGKER